MGEETDEYVESTSKLRDLVKGYTGFDIMDDENNFKDLYEIVLGIGQAWGDLEDIQKAALGEALGGKRNARGLYSIFDHLDTLTSAYESSVNSAGSAMKEQEHYAESVQYSIDRTKASLQELAHDFLSSDLLKGLIEGANTFLQIVDKIISSLGTVGTLLTGGGIASFVHGMATNKGLMAGLFENLASRNGGVAGSSMLSNILKTFTGGTAGNTAQKAGEGIARNIGEGIERRGSYHIGDAVTNALAAGFTREVIPYGDGDFVEVWKNKAGEIVQETQGATRALDASLVESATQSGTTAGTGFASAFASAITAHPLIASAIGIAVAAGLTAAIVAGVNNYQKHQRARNATKALEAWNDTQENTQNYQQRYKELKEGLNNATTEADQVSYREQILALQQEIIGQYGSEASAVDLVNGKLEEQLGVIADISDKQMQKNMRDPDFVHAIHDAEETFNKVGDFQLGTTVFDGSNKDFEKDLTEVVNDLSKKYTKDGVEVGFELEADGVDGTKSINIKNATKVQAKQIMDEYKAQLENLSEKYINDDSVQLELGGLIDRGSLGSGQIQKDVDEYWDLYIYSLQRKLSQPQKDLVDSYKQSMSDLTTAMSSGEGFDEAYDNFANLNQRVTDELDSQFDPYIKNIKDSYSGISEDALALRDILDNDSFSKNNPLKDQADELKNTAEELKDLNIKPIDIEEIMNDPEKSTNKAKEAVMALTKAYGILGEDITADKNALPGFIDLLTELGIATEASADKAVDGSQSFESFRSSIINDIANIDTLNAAIAESVNGKGLSYSIDESTGEIVGSMATIKNAYADLMDGTEPQALFERTANGIHINQEKLRELKSELQASKIKEFTEQETNLLKEQQDIRSKINSLTANGVNADNTSELSGLQSQLDAVGEKIGNLKDLRSAWEGATSAYQQWVESQSAGEEGDMYNTIRDTALKRGEELWTAGLTGTNEFRAIAQMLSNEDLTTAPIEKIEAAYQNGSKAVKQFFTDDVDGLLKFSETVQAMGDEVGYVSETDDAYNFFGIDMDAVAEKLGVSRDIVDAIFRRFSDYGYNTRFFDEDQVEELQKIKQGVDEVQSALKDSADFSVEFGDGSQKSFSDIVDFDFVEIGEDADALNAKLAELQTARADPDINSDQAKLLDELIQLCIQDLDILDGYHASPDGPNLETWKTSQTLLQNFEAEMQELDKANASPGVSLTIEDSPEAMKIVDAFMNDPDLALMAHIDISKGRDDVIRQLEEMHANGVDVDANVDADVNSGQVQDEVGSAISGASGTPDVKVDEGSVTSQTQEGIKAADGTTVIPEANADQAANETKSKIEGVKPKVDVQAKTANFASQITNAAKKAASKAAGAITGKKTTQETVSKETKETTSIENKQTNITVSGNYDEAVKIRTAVASIPTSRNVKVTVDTGNAIAGINKVVAREESIKDKNFNITANGSQAISTIGTVRSSLNSINDKTITIGASWGQVRGAVDSVNRMLGSIKDKQVKITTIKETVQKADGTAHWQGTAGGYYSPKRNGSVGNSFINHYNGTAYAGGNWGLKKDEPNALINELGPEIIVRDGSWFIVNNGYPTLADSSKGIPGGLQKGDIVFNHKQAEDILKHGYVTGSHAKLIGGARAEGSAHAEGTTYGGKAFAKIRKKKTGSSGGGSGSGKSGSGGGNGSKGSKGSKGKGTTTTKKETKLKKIKGLLPDDINVETFDLIEIKLKVLERELGNLKDAADSAFNTFETRGTQTSLAIDKVTDSIKDNNTAASKYQSRADSALKNGKYKLTSQEIEAAKKAGLGGSADEIKKNFDNGKFKISDIKINSKAQSQYDKAKQKDDKKSTKDTRKALRKAEKKLQQNQIKESLKNKIAQYQEWADKAVEARQSVLELQEQEKELYAQRFDLEKTNYDAQVQRLESRSDLLNEWISKNENMGNYSSSKVYEELAKNEGSKITKLEEERGKLREKLQEAMAHGIAKNSEKYNEMQAAIDDVTKSIYSAQTAQEEFNKKVRELNYENFKLLQDRISGVSEELSFLTDIMSENPMYGQEGSLTSYGIATLGTYVAQYEIAIKQAKDYAVEIKRLQSILKGTYKPKKGETLPGAQEARNQLAELQEAQRSIIKTQYDMRKSIKSLVEEGFKKEIDSLKEAISEYEKMLDIQKSEADYSKKIRDQQEKITSLRRQLASWSGDTSEEGAAKRQKTSKELRDAEETLRDSQEDRRISQTKEMLSELQDSFENLINARLEDISNLIKDVLGAIGNYQGNIGQTLEEVITASGLTASSDIIDLKNSLKSEVAVPINKKLESGITIGGLLGGENSIAGSLTSLNKNTSVNSSIGSKVSSILSTLQSTLKVELASGESAGKKAVDTVDNDSKPTVPASSGGGGGGGGKPATTATTAPKKATTTTAPKKATTTKKSSSSDNGVPKKIKTGDDVRKFINAYASKAKKKKSAYSDVNKVVYSNTRGLVLSEKEMKDLAKRVGVKYNNASKNGNLYKKLKKLKATGFRKGTNRVPDDDYFWTQEGLGQNELITRKSDGAMLTRLGKGDMVFNADMTKTLWKFAKDPAPFMTNGAIKAPDVSSNVTYGDSNVDITFNLPNVTNSDDFIRTLQKSKKFEQIVQSMTIGQLKGKGTLNKYNTRI